MLKIAERNVNNIAIGAQGEAVMDNSGKSILVRGCDPVMAKKQEKWYLHNFGNPKFVACTNMTFLEKISDKKWALYFLHQVLVDIMLQKQPMPGGRAATKGWGLDQYEQLVRERQGEDVQIVETVENVKSSCCDYITKRLNSIISNGGGCCMF